MELFFSSPTVIDPNVKRLLSRLNSNKQPVVLQIEPEPEAGFGDCFFNVDDKVKKDGGSVCLGWAILQGGAIIEAEAHAVWRNPNGHLVDITPRESRFKSSTIMFVEDPTLVFQGKLIDNIRLNVTNNLIVDHIIKIEETIVAIQIPFTKVYRGSQTQPENINKIVLSLRKEIENLTQFAKSGGHLGSPCFCNSGLLYISCHGRVEEGMREVIEGVKPFLQNYIKD